MFKFYTLQQKKIFKYGLEKIFLIVMYLKPIEEFESFFLINLKKPFATFKKLYKGQLCFTHNL